MHTRRLFQTTLNAAMLAAFWLGPLPALATSEKLELADAIQLAQQTNPELRALNHRTEAARARIGTAGALPDPKARFTYFGESVETRTGPQEAIYSISQRIPWPAKLQTRKVVAEHGAAAADWLYHDAQLRINEALTRAYTEAVYHREAIRITEAKLKWVLESRPIVEERVRGGETINALLRIDVEIERLRDRLDQFAQARATARARLASLAGLPESDLGELGALPEPTKTDRDPTAAHSAMVAENPGLRRLKSQARGAGSMAERSRMDRYPDFTVGLNYIQVGDSGAPVRDAGRDPWNVTVAIDLPIWNGKNRASLRSALAEKRASEEQYQSQLLGLHAELSTSLSEKATSLRRMARHRDTLIPLAEQALENSRAAYQSGQTSILELIDSEQALLELELNYLRASVDSIQHEATILRLTNGTNPANFNES